MFIRNKIKYGIIKFNKNKNKFILNILEDDLETVEKEEIPAIVFSLECSPKENTTFKFASANDLLKLKVNKIFKKMKTGYSI